MRKRVALAYALLEGPDLLLLVEPTSHLDFEGIRWLEEQILNFKGAVIVITHDRRFLDTVTTRIIVLDRGQLFSFPVRFEKWKVKNSQFGVVESLAHSRFNMTISHIQARLSR